MRGRAALVAAASVWVRSGTWFGLRGRDGRLTGDREPRDGDPCPANSCAGRLTQSPKTELFQCSQDVNHVWNAKELEELRKGGR
jgi:hypothetical protein